MSCTIFFCSRFLVTIYHLAYPCEKNPSDILFAHLPVPTASKGNLSLGLGVKLNNGTHSRKGEVPSVNQSTGTVTYSTQTMDQAIQPGDGGVGISIEVQGFRQLYKGIYGFASGYYLFNPRESNGSFKSAPTEVKDEQGNTLGVLTGYNVYASPDQYFARAGVMTAVGKMKNVTLSLAGRWEGIPAYDAFGGQVAYRRPGLCHGC